MGKYPIEARSPDDEILGNRKLGDKRVPTPIVEGTGKHRGGTRLSHRGQDEKDLAIYELTGGETSIVNPEMDSDTDYEAAKRTISQDNARAWKALDKISLRLKGKKEDDEEIRISRGNTSHDATLEEYDAWTPSTLMGVNGIEMSQARNDEAMAAGDRPFKKPEDPMKRVKEVVVKRPSQENEIEQNQISMIQADRGKSLKSLDKISLRLKEGFNNEKGVTRQAETTDHARTGSAQNEQYSGEEGVDQAVSEEEPLEELTDGELTEVEKPVKKDHHTRVYGGDNSGAAGAGYYDDQVSRPNKAPSRVKEPFSFLREDEFPYPSPEIVPSKGDELDRSGKIVPRDEHHITRLARQRRLYGKAVKECSECGLSFDEEGEDYEDRVARHLASHKDSQNRSSHNVSGKENKFVDEGKRKRVTWDTKKFERTGDEITDAIGLEEERLARQKRRHAAGWTPDQRSHSRRGTGIRDIKNLPTEAELDKRMAERKVQNEKKKKPRFDILFPPSIDDDDELKKSLAELKVLLKAKIKEGDANPQVDEEGQPYVSHRGTGVRTARGHHDVTPIGTYSRRDSTARIEGDEDSSLLENAPEGIAGDPEKHRTRGTFPKGTKKKPTNPSITPTTWRNTKTPSTGSGAAFKSSKKLEDAKRKLRELFTIVDLYPNEIKNSKMYAGDKEKAGEIEVVKGILDNVKERLVALRDRNKPKPTVGVDPEINRTGDKARKVRKPKKVGMPNQTTSETSTRQPVFSKKKPVYSPSQAKRSNTNSVRAAAGEKPLQTPKQSNAKRQARERKTAEELEAHNRKIIEQLGTIQEKQRRQQMGLKS